MSNGLLDSALAVNWNVTVFSCKQPSKSSHLRALKVHVMIDVKELSGCEFAGVMGIE